MNLPLMFCCVLVLHLGPVQGILTTNVTIEVLPLEPVQGTLTPDDTIQIAINKSVNGSSPVGTCIAARQTTTVNVRFMKFTSKSNSTFVRRHVPDAFAACLDGAGQTLAATTFMACAADTDKAGLTMFKFMDGACTGYPFTITLDQQSCLGSGPNVLYVNLKKTAAARSHSETGRSPAFREQGTPRVLTMSTDVIVDDDGFKGIEGKGLNTNQTYRKLEVINKCQCHYFCSVDSACNAFSVVRLSSNSSSSVCSLANANVYTNTPSSVNGSYYAVKAALVDPHSIDNLIYKRLNTAVQGFTNQKVACEAVPGYRLVTVKFEAQMPILLALCLGREPSSATEDCVEATPDVWFYVDMIKLAGVPKIQGVLPLADTDITSVEINEPDSTDHFVYAHSRKLHDESPFNHNSRPVCQANVYGVSW